MLVEVDVIVDSGPAKVYSVDVYVGTVTLCTGRVVDSSVTEPVEGVGITCIVVVIVTSETASLGVTPLSQ